MLGFCFTEDSDGTIAERHNVFNTSLHAASCDRPTARLKIHLIPCCGARLAAASSGKNKKLERETTGKVSSPLAQARYERWYFRMRQRRMVRTVVPSVT